MELNIKILLLINLIIIILCFLNVFNKYNVIFFSLIDKIHDKIISYTNLRQNKKINEILSRFANNIINTDENIAKVKNLKLYITIVMSVLKILLLFLILFNFTSKVIFFFFLIIFIYMLLLEIDWYLYSQVKLAFDLVDVYIVKHQVLVKIDEEYYMNTDPIAKKYEIKIKEDKGTVKNKSVTNRLYWFSLLRWKYTTVYKEIRKTNNIINLILSIILFIRLLCV